MLQIRLLGQFDIRLDGKRVTIPTRAAQSLLAYLALTAGTPHRREKLAGTFWPDVTEEMARKNLRQELWRIRKAISAVQLTEGDTLIADELTLKFNREAAYWLDVVQMERPDLDLQSLIANLSLYQGELLPGFYDEWVMLERERIQAVFDARMEQLLEQLITAERWIAVQEWGERWLTLSGVREPAYRALMMTSAVRGDMAKVASLYQRCTDELMEYLGVEPSPETRALYDDLLKRVKAPPRATVAQPSGTITFLFTDIEGSTRMLEMLGDKYAVALSEHHEIMRAAIQKWNGREVDTQGDAFFVTFARSLDAVQCAAESQRALASHAWPQGESLRVRMGLHTGEPLIASTGYVGMDVHRAARIGDAAHGGQILLSQTTRELIIHDLPEGMDIRDLGEYRLKDMKYPTPIYQLVVDGLPADFAPLRTKFTGTESPTPGEAPFKGLQFFDVEDSELFFGREKLTAKLLHRLHETKFLSVIIGASGSGKSSLVRAGLVPAIKKAGELVDGTKTPEGSANWQIHIITPAEHPLEALAIELTRDSESVTAAATLVDDLSKDPRSLYFFLARRAQINNATHTLLVIDQFEELFTLCRDQFEREAFIDNLLTALTPPSLPLGDERRGKGNMTLILTLRADFYAHLAQYPEMRDAVAQQQEYIGPMTSEELRLAIEEPARRGRWEFEPGLVDLILRDVGDEPGALPLLSHALLETWKRRAGHTLTLKGYADAGGVRGAIAHTAENVFQNLSLDEQAIMRNILLRLTEFGEGTEDTRRRASFDELMSSAEDADEVRTVLNKLAEARLVTLSEDTAEVAHEALIREWPQLREWLSQDREGNILHRHLTEAAQEWELLGRDSDSVYRGARLAQANEWSALNHNALNAREKMFLEASNQQARQEEQEREEQQQRELAAVKELAETQRQSASRLRIRNRVITTVGAIAVTLALLAGIFGVQSNRNAIAAQNNAATAQAEAGARATQQAIAETNLTHADALRLAGEANKLFLTLGIDVDLMTLLSIRSMNIQYSPQGDAALEGAMTLPFPHSVFTGHTDNITSAAYSPDGNYILTGSADKTARLWDAHSGEEVRQFTAHTDVVTDVAFSPDGTYIATAGKDERARLWDTQTGQLIRVFTHPWPVNSVTFSPDGRYIITSRTDTAQLWDVQSGKQVRSYTQSGNIYALALSYDGKYLLTGGKAKVVHLWSVQTGIELRQFSLTVAIRCLAFSPDGQYILTAGGDNIVQMLDINTSQVVRRFVGHTFEIYHMMFSPNGKYILTGSGDNTARLWNAETGDQIRTLSAATGNLSAGGAVFSPDGKYIFTASAKIGRLWDTESAINTGLPKFVRPNDPVYAAAFSPDSKYVLTASASQNMAILWDIQTRKEIRDFVGHNDYIQSLTFSPDGKYILTGGGNGDNTARLWDVQTGQELYKVGENMVARGLTVAFSPNGKYIATVSIHAVLWDAKSGQEIRTFVGHARPVSAVTFSPDSHYLLTGSGDGTAILWDVETDEILQRFKHPEGDQVNCVAFSPDGKSALTGGSDSLLRLWDIQTGTEIREFTGHTAAIETVSFSPDGKYALSAGHDYTARLWDVATGIELRRFVGHTATVESAVFSPDGNYVLTGADDGTARIWPVDYHDEIQYLCAHLTRDFTNEERKQYEIKDTKPTCPKS
jgi:WD40 repeat protein/class 3 adenylate cyclase